MSDREKMITIRVTMTQDYLVPVWKNGRTFNNWTVEELIKDWFERVDINRAHATRDAHRLVGSIKQVLIEVKDKE